MCDFVGCLSLKKIILLSCAEFKKIIKHKECEVLNNRFIFYVDNLLQKPRPQSYTNIANFRIKTKHPPAITRAGDYYSDRS